jgi:hypothetical protein
MRTVTTLAVCLLGIGTSHAGLIVDRDAGKIHDVATASSWRGNQLQLRQTDLDVSTNYSAIKREHIKFSWSSNGRGNAARVEPTLSVPEPGTLALLALGLIGVGIARRRQPR